LKDYICPRTCVSFIGEVKITIIHKYSAKSSLCHPDGSVKVNLLCAPLADDNISPINHSFHIKTVEVSSDTL